MEGDRVMFSFVCKVIFFFLLFYPIHPHSPSRVECNIFLCARICFLFFFNLTFINKFCDKFYYKKQTLNLSIQRLCRVLYVIIKTLNNDLIYEYKTRV